VTHLSHDLVELLHAIVFVCVGHQLVHLVEFLLKLLKYVVFLSLKAENILTTLLVLRILQWVSDIRYRLQHAQAKLVDPRIQELSRDYDCNPAHIVRVVDELLEAEGLAILVQVSLRALQVAELTDFDLDYLGVLLYLHVILILIIFLECEF